MKLSVLISLLPLICSAKLVFASTETSETTETETYNDDPLNFSFVPEESFQKPEQSFTDRLDKASQQELNIRKAKNEFDENLGNELRQELINRDIPKGKGPFKKLLQDQQKKQSFLSHLPKQLEQEIDQRAARKDFDETLRNELRQELLNRDISKGEGPFKKLLEDQQKKLSFKSHLPKQLEQEINQRAARKDFDENLRNELRQELLNRDISKGEGPFKKLLEDQLKHLSFKSHLPKQLEQEIIQRAARKEFNENLRNELRQELLNRDISKGEGSFKKLLEDQQKKLSFKNSLGTELAKKVVRIEPLDFSEELNAPQTHSMLWQVAKLKYRSLLEECNNDILTDMELETLADHLTMESSREWPRGKMFCSEEEEDKYWNDLL